MIKEKLIDVILKVLNDADPDVDKALEDDLADAVLTLLRSSLPAEETDGDWDKALNWTTGWNAYRAELMRILE